MLANCHLNRPTNKVLAEAGKWSKMEAGEIGFETMIEVFPHVFGRLLK